MNNASDLKPAPLLSILLPVYNVAPYLAECVRSIFSQDASKPIEVVILDDCSTDGSLEIAEQLCAYYGGQIRILQHTENRGISAARNSLIDAARGTYIWYVDPDDRLFPLALSGLFAILESEAPDIILCDFSKNDGAKIASFQGVGNALENNIEDLIRGVFAARHMHCWSKISKRSLWGDDLRFPVGKVFEDISVTPYLLLRARTYFYAPQKWIFYRQRNDSILGLLSRKAGFEEEGHQNLASALIGFKERLLQERGHVNADTRFAISHFLARSFTKIGFKLLRERLLSKGWRKTQHMMGDYLAMTESASPMSFDQLQNAYYERGIYGRLAVLCLCRCMSSRSNASIADSNIVLADFDSEDVYLSVELMEKTR